MENNIQPTPEVTPETPPVPLSEFKGTTLQLIGWHLLGILLSAITLGIAAPWTNCMIYRWETKHTYINGKQLHFDGKGHQLLGKYLLWGLLVLVTLGIYAMFIPVRMHKWRAEHTRFAVPADEAAGSRDSAMIFGYTMAGVAAVLLIALVATVLVPKLTQQSQPSGMANNIFTNFFNSVPDTTLSGEEDSFQFCYWT